MNNRKSKSDVPVHLIVIINQSKLDMMDITKFECKLLLMQLPSATAVASAACIRILLHDLNISDEYLPKALEALNVDSQQGIFGKRGLNQIRDHKYVFQELDQLFKKYSISMFCDINFDEFKCFVTCNTT